MKSTLSQASQLIELYLQLKLVPMLKGSPGIGKSQAVYAIAKKYNLLLIDLRLSQCDPVDLMGFPKVTVTPNGDRGGYVPMTTFPIEGDPIPKGYNGWLLFLDELNAAPTAVQAAAYKLILDKMVGQYKLHKNVAIVAAGNLETDNAIVEEMSTALQSRMVHIEAYANVKEFIDWATDNSLDSRITSYFELCPQNLHKFHADHTGHTYPCPRTWEFTNRIIKDTPESSPLFLMALAGAIGEGTAREFSAYCELYAQLPKISQLISNPKGIPMPEEPGVLWALTGAVSEATTDGNLASLLEFVDRMPIEFQVVTTRQMRRKHPQLEHHKAMAKWVAANAAHIY
jgi:hypothetical protein